MYAFHLSPITLPHEKHRTGMICESAIREQREPINEHPPTFARSLLAAYLPSCVGSVDEDQRRGRGKIFEGCRQGSAPVNHVLRLDSSPSRCRLWLHTVGGGRHQPCSTYWQLSLVRRHAKDIALLVQVRSTSRAWRT